MRISKFSGFIFLLLLTAAYARQSPAHAFQSWKRCAQMDVRVLKHDKFTSRTYTYRPKQDSGIHVIFVAPLRPNWATRVFSPLLEQELATRMCLEGFTVHRLVANPIDSTVQTVASDLNFHQDQLNEYMHQMDKIYELEMRKNTQSQFSCLGPSLGGIICAVAMGKKPWLSKGVIALAGGNVAEILDDTHLKYLQDIKDLRISQHPEATDYQTLMQPFLHDDPLTSAKPTDCERIMFFETPGDDIVPAKNQEMLWKAFGEPTRKLYSEKTSHTDGIIRLYYRDFANWVEFLRNPKK